MDIRAFVKAFMLAQDAEKKQKQVDKLEATTLNYGIIRDLINSAQNDVVIHVTTKDGVKIDIERKDPYDKLNSRQYTEAF